MGNKVYLNSNIIIIEVVGDQTVESVEQMGRQIDGLISQQRRIGAPCLVLDNLLQMGNVGPDARKRVVDLAKELDYDRLALLGKGGIMRFGTNLMLRATGRSYKLRYFDDRSQALAWLHQT